MVHPPSEDRLFEAHLTVSTPELTANTATLVYPASKNKSSRDTASSGRTIVQHSGRPRVTAACGGRHMTHVIDPTQHFTPILPSVSPQLLWVTTTPTQTEPKLSQFCF